MGGHSETNVAGPRHVPVDTPDFQLQRSGDLNNEYSQLKSDMLEEVKQMDDRIIRPAEDARAALTPMKKTLKKREDRKVW